MRGDGAAIGDLSRAVKLHALLAGKRTGIRDAVVADNAYRTCRGGVAGQGDFSLIIDIQVTRLAGDIAQRDHAYPGFRTDKFDLIGIHAANGSNVDSDRRLAVIALDHLYAKVRIVDDVGANHHIEIIRPQLAIHRHRTCNQIQLVQVVAIQASAIDLNIAACHTKCLQAAIAAEHRRAGRQDTPRGIDESAS